jgi:hypothetical protein
VGMTQICVTTLGGASNALPFLVRMPQSGTTIDTFEPDGTLGGIQCSIQDFRQCTCRQHGSGSREFDDRTHGRERDPGRTEGQNLNL